MVREDDEKKTQFATKHINVIGKKEKQASAIARAWDVIFVWSKPADISSYYLAEK